jgi:hypothetical protein
MKILITNHALASRRGTELFVRDLTAALFRGGNTVYVYSPNLGTIAEECRAFGATVTDNISKLNVIPDVIHGHHYSAVAAAALRFPSTPIVYVCHGVFPPQEWPIKLPTIKRYVAVSNLTRARISEVTGIDIQDIEILSNFVDLSRFRNQRTLPDTPKKALLFGNYWKTDSKEYNAIEEGCRRYGISSIDVRGESEKIAVQPELELPNYDIVFAVGRSAIEAMTAGAAVILADVYGIGGMVMPSNFDSLRSMNFALEATRKNLLTVDSVYTNLLMYNRAGMGIVTKRARSELNLDLAVSKWKEIYIDAINSPKGKCTSGAVYSAVFLIKWQQRKTIFGFALSLMLFVIRKFGRLQKLDFTRLD